MIEEDKIVLMASIVDTINRLFEGNVLSDELRESLSDAFESVMYERAVRDLMEVELNGPASVEELVSRLRAAVSSDRVAGAGTAGGGSPRVRPVISEHTDNICVLSDSSSSDNQSESPLEPPLKCPRRSQRRSGARQQSRGGTECKRGSGGASGDTEEDIIEIIIDDNDIEDEDEHQSKENIDYSQKNNSGGSGGGKRRPNSQHQNNCSNNQTQSQHKYDFRQRRHRPDYCARSNSNSTVSNGNSVASDNHKTSNSRPATAEVIQIEDSSDDNNGDSDDDVQEIGRETRPGFTGFATFTTFTGTGTGTGTGRSNNSHNNNNNYFRRSNGFKGPTINTSAPPTEADPSQLASIPMVVTFPTMRAASFNGHLYISHNHKFSVKLQGIDPRSFRWNDSR